MKTTEYIDRAREATGTHTDYQLAKLLGIDDSAMQHYRHGRRTMDTYTAARLAEVLRINPLEVIAAAEAERARDATKRAYWEQHLKTFARRAPAGLLVILGLPFILMSARTLDADGTMLSEYVQTLCNKDYAHLWIALALVVLATHARKHAAAILKRTAAILTPQATT